MTDTPVYTRLTVAEHLKLGARLNPGWDHVFARDRLTLVDHRHLGWLRWTSIPT